MSKNVTIAEGSQAKNFNTVKKLRTNLIGGGNQYWIPENEAGNYIDTKVLSIEKNGTYSAHDSNCDAFSEVITNVKPITMEKQININGSYNASADNVQAYSSIEVNVVKGDDTEIGDYYYPVSILEEDSEWQIEGGIQGVGGFIIVYLQDYQGNVTYGKRYACFTTNGRIYVWDDGRNGWVWYRTIPSETSARGAVLFSFREEDGGSLESREFVVVSLGIPNNNYYNQIWNYRKPMPGDTVLDWLHDANWPGIGGRNACKIGNEIHIFGRGTGGAVSHAVYRDGGIETIDLDADALPEEDNMQIGMYKGEVYALAQGSQNFYKYNGFSGGWTLINKFPIRVPNTYVFLVEHKNKLHVFAYNYHYSFNGRWWRKEETVGTGNNVVAAWVSVEDDDVIHIVKANKEHCIATYTE